MDGSQLSLIDSKFPSKRRAQIMLPEWVAVALEHEAALMGRSLGQHLGDLVTAYALAERGQVLK